MLRLRIRRSIKALSQEEASDKTAGHGRIKTVVTVRNHNFWVAVQERRLPQLGIYAKGEVSLKKTFGDVLGSMGSD